jgi:hypothetical protein
MQTRPQLVAVVLLLLVTGKLDAVPETDPRTDRKPASWSLGRIPNTPEVYDQGGTMISDCEATSGGVYGPAGLYNEGGWLIVGAIMVVQHFPWRQFLTRGDVG